MKTIFDTTDPQFWGYAFLIAGIIVRFLIGSRRYKRRGAGGLQHFEGRFYGTVLFIILIEWIMKWAALAAILVGLFMILNARP